MVHTEHPFSTIVYLTVRRVTLILPGMKEQPSPAARLWLAYLEAVERRDARRKLEAQVATPKKKAA